MNGKKDLKIYLTTSGIIMLLFGFLCWKSIIGTLPESLAKGMPFLCITMIFIGLSGAFIMIAAYPNKKDGK